MAVKNVQSYIQESQIFTSNACIILENNKIETIEIKTPLQEIYQINGLEVPNKYVLSFAGILSYYSNELSHLLKYPKKKDSQTYTNNSVSLP